MLYSEKVMFKALLQVNRSKLSVHIWHHCQAGQMRNHMFPNPFKEFYGALMWLATTCFYNTWSLDSTGQWFIAVKRSLGPVCWMMKELNTLNYRFLAKCVVLLALISELPLQRAIISEKSAFFIPVALWFTIVKYWKCLKNVKIQNIFILS